MYDEISNAVARSSVIKEILHNRDEQLGRWVQQFCLLYSKHNIVTYAALKYTESLPTIDDLDSERTIDELSNGITEMASWKVPGIDGIPADFFLQCKSCLLPLLHESLVKCWRVGKVAEDIRDANVITLYKNKGTRSDYNKHRGISLIGIAKKKVLNIYYFQAYIN